jgi:type IV pilus assembly protein PilO
MDQNDRNILILGILILVVLAIAYYFLLFSPLRQDYLAKYDERTRREAQKQQLEQTAAQLENIRRNSDDIERQILELSKRIPEQAEIPTLVVQIEEVAQAADVTQLRIEPGDPEAPPGGGDFSRIPITMSFEGTYEQLQDFLLRVRNLARLVTINEVNYEPVEERRGGETTVSRDVEDLLTVEIVAEIYVQPAAGGDTTGGGSAPSPAPGGNAKDKGKAKDGGAAKGGAKGGGTAK